MTAPIRARLRAIFFLEYFIKGAWYPLLGLYLGAGHLGFSGIQQAWVFNAFAIATVSGMFLGGQVADRAMTRGNFLAISHLMGGLALFGLATVRDFGPFLGLMAVHCFFYVPTLSVANAVAFDSVDDPRRDFGPIRLWGTIGWVASAWPIVLIPVDWARVGSVASAGGVVPWLGTAVRTLKTGGALEASLAGTFVVAGLASLALAGLCLTLPRKEVAIGRGERFAPFEAIRLLARPWLLVLFIVTFLDSMVHNCYYFWTSRFLKSIGVPENFVAPAMSLGQVMEAVAMALLGSILRRLGWKRTLILGVLAQALRFGVYSIGTPDLLPVVIAVNLAHGFAYACFFGTVYIFVDESFPEDVRASAQSLFNLVIYGVSALVSNFVWGGLGEAFSTTTAVGDLVTTTVDFRRLFAIPFGASLVAATMLALFFRPPAQPSET